MVEFEVVYRPREGATAESELSALMATYRYLIFDCHAGDKDARPGAHDDETNSKEDSASDDIIQ
jgi:hypothetical protein